jgi:hypothetical protein
VSRVPPAEFAPHEADRLRARLEREGRILVLLRSTVCPYGAAFRPAFFELAAARGIRATDLLVGERDDAQWSAWAMRISPTVMLVEEGRETARLEGKLLLGITRQRYARWLSSTASPAPAR